MSADSERGTLKALKRSLEKYNFPYEVIGLGKPWSGFITKMENYEQAINEYIKQSGPDALAVFIDAYDTLCIKSPEDTIAAYKSKPRKMSILIGAETYCLGNCKKETLQWYDHHKILGGSAKVRERFELVDGHPDLLKSPQPVFPNSGLIMGPAKDLATLFSAMKNSGIPDDQLAAGDYLVKNPSLVDIDIEEKVFRNKIDERNRLSDEGTAKGPAFLHFPGSATTRDKLLEIFKQYE